MLVRIITIIVIIIIYDGILMEAITPNKKSGRPSTKPASLIISSAVSMILFAYHPTKWCRQILSA